MTSLCQANGNTVELKHYADGGRLPQQANARLIAAAPELLDLLKEAQARHFVHNGNDDLYDRMTAAIAKAAGVTHG